MVAAARVAGGNRLRRIEARNGEFAGLIWAKGKRKDGKFECDAIQCDSWRVIARRANALVGVDRGGAAARYLLVRYRSISGNRDDRLTYQTRVLGMQLSNIRVLRQHRLASRQVQQDRFDNSSLMATHVTVKVDNQSVAQNISHSCVLN